MLLKPGSFSGEDWRSVEAVEQSKMPAELLVFVCEGPTCCDKWGTSAPRTQIARQLEEHELTNRVHLQTEICFGHCQRGANLVTQPFSESARWRGADLTVSGARVHHQMNVSQAVQTLVRLLDRGRDGDLAVAANPEVA